MSTHAKRRLDELEVEERQLADRRRKLMAAIDYLDTVPLVTPGIGDLGVLPVTVLTAIHRCLLVSNDMVTLGALARTNRVMYQFNPLYTLDTVFHQCSPAFLRTVLSSVLLHSYDCPRPLSLQTRDVKKTMGSGVCVYVWKFLGNPVDVHMFNYAQTWYDQGVTLMLANNLIWVTQRNQTRHNYTLVVRQLSYHRKQVN
jgi:hypothetical protein